jgi:uncharacterized protein
MTTLQDLGEDIVRGVGLVPLLIIQSTSSNAVVVDYASSCTVRLPAASEHVIPGRWEDVREPSESELKATSVLWLPLSEVSAKVRRGPPIDDKADYELPVWAGELPLSLIAGAPVADSRLIPNGEMPVYVLQYQRRRCVK